MKTPEDYIEQVAALTGEVAGQRVLIKHLEEDRDKLLDRIARLEAMLYGGTNDNLQS